MPRTAASVKQADIARIVRGMRAAGVSNVRAVIRPDGVYIESDDREAQRVDHPRDAAVAEPERIVPL